jgi:hypothetical protein
MSKELETARAEAAFQEKRAALGIEILDRKNRELALAQQRITELCNTIHGLHRNITSTVIPIEECASCKELLAPTPQGDV